jgi:hypothetical protein
MASEFPSEFAQLALLINEYGPDDPLRQDANRPPKSTFDGVADGSSESPAPGPLTMVRKVLQTLPQDLLKTPTSTPSFDGTGLTARR